MATLNAHLSFGFLLLATTLCAASAQRLSHEAFTCKLVEDKLLATNPWSEYPIVYEPIKRGRLTIWAGMSGLQISEFQCYDSPDIENSVVLDFANYANKLDWTFFDINKGVTHHGFTVNHQEDVKFNVTLENRQSKSFLSCNQISNIERIDTDDEQITVNSSCEDCGRSVISMVDNQIRELLKTKLQDTTIDNLYWHLNQLVINQHYSSPLSINDQ